MRARLKPLEGDYVRWDGTNAAELKALAGNLLEGVYESAALVRNLDGDLVHVRPGWVVSRWDGVAGAGVFSTAAWRAYAGEAP